MTFHILGIIIPTDEVIFFRGVGQPPTSKSSRGPFSINPPFIDDFSTKTSIYWKFPVIFQLVNW